MIEKWLSSLSRAGATALLGACVAVGLGLSGPAEAQKKGAPPQQSAPPQVALSPKQIEGFIAGYKAIAPILEKLARGKKADPKLEAQADASAKKYGFSGLDEFDTVANSITVVMAGIDPKTRKFEDPIGSLKKALAEVQADKTLKPAERKKELQELNAALAEAQPVQHPGNIPLVIKYFDQLNAILPADDQQQGAPPPPQQKGKR